ncbi:MAG TPA: relaxase/mobilization nuclease domain-containing protein [Steroidobacteraceae bacterium]|jgi:hypothetical protein|nr:relaxase/mobilization nuclease domain-containing protein [Steroidobacteraceae bacterium]
MSRQTEGGQLALFELRSFGRLGPQPGTLSPHQVAQIARTVRRTPEVMVKVSGGAKSLQGAVAHFRYIDRRGTLEVESDDGRTLRGNEAAAGLVDSWDLATTQARDRNQYRGRPGRGPSKLVHNLVFSMPKATAPDKVLAAVRGFAREQFALQHRYALVLHTDQDHPHVHLAVKAVGEDGRRLNIRKATLRQWRSAFAEQLRAQGVAANATPRAERGRSRSPLKDAIYRAAERGASTHLLGRLKKVAGELQSGAFRPGTGKARLLETRRAVVKGWAATAEALAAAGQGALAAEVRQFIAQMPAPKTTDEELATHLSQVVRDRQIRNKPPLTR